MYFSTHDAATLRRLVENGGFEVERTAIETQVEAGVEIPFCWLPARVPT